MQQECIILKSVFDKTFSIFYSWKIDKKCVLARIDEFMSSVFFI